MIVRPRGDVNPTQEQRMKTFNYQRFYDRFSGFYAPLVRLIPVWFAYSCRALERAPQHGRVLEIGPGPGLLLERAAQSRQYACLVGLDLSWGMLLQAQRRLQRAGVHSFLVQGDAVHLPFARHTFDGVVMSFVFGAIPDGLGALREVARVLRPGGVLSMVEAGVPSDGNIGGTLLAKLWTFFGDILRDEALLMQEAGLTVIHREEFGPFQSLRLVVGRKDS